MERFKCSGALVLFGLGMKLQVGDEVKVINKKSKFYGKVFKVGWVKGKTIIIDGMYFGRKEVRKATGKEKVVFT